DERDEEGEADEPADAAAPVGHGGGLLVARQSGGDSGGQQSCRCHESFPSMSVALPRSHVGVTRPRSSRPSYGVLRLREAKPAGSTCSRYAVSTRVRFAGSPTETGRPCPFAPPIRAGLTDMRSATPAQSSRPVSTMVSWTTDRAVSRPTMPMA